MQRSSVQQRHVQQCSGAGPGTTGLDVIVMMIIDTLTAQCAELPPLLSFTTENH
jgi:hypothetical protein